jgi:1,2-dihydroxy-3-keto-5-methylthiopentene dioxygenase
MRVLHQQTWLDSRQHSPQAIQDLLAPIGVEVDYWPGLNAHESPLDSNEVLRRVETSLNTLKARRLYFTEDVVQLGPDLPNLQEILKPFEAPHYHTDDEVRVCVDGEGIFRLYPDPVMCPESIIDIHVIPGDCIVLPAFLMHSFHLTPQQHITAIRIFKENPRWEAHYEWPSVPIRV